MLVLLSLVCPSVVSVFGRKSIKCVNPIYYSICCVNSVSPLDLAMSINCTFQTLQDAGWSGRSAHVDAPARLVADGAHGRQSADAAAGRARDAGPDVAAPPAGRHDQRPQELRADPDAPEAGRHHVSAVNSFCKTVEPFTRIIIRKINMCL